MNRTFQYLGLLLATMAFIVSCQKENLDASIQQPNSTAVDDTHLDGLPIQQLLPDLIITQFATTVTATTAGCNAIVQDTLPVGQLKDDEEKLDKRIVVVRPVNLQCPNVSCQGGQRSFIATVTIKNIGNRNLPAGQISVLWTDITLASSQTQIVSHPGIPVGGTFQVSRPFFMGPCDCVPPFQFFKHLFKATVDPLAAIPEINENNNMSKVFRACDGC